MNLQIIKLLFNDFVKLFYPDICPGCERMLVQGENSICLKCVLELPRNLYFHNNSELLQRFWGKTKIENCSAYLCFHKDGLGQKLLYAIKYHRNTQLAVELGRWLGIELKKEFFSFDFIVPVPLHQKRFKKRGYNQSEFFAIGISSEINCRIEKILQRAINNTSQTGKTREERWESVMNSFYIEKNYHLYGQHILLVDDVITTGATVQACAQLLLDAGAAKVSVASIAYAK